MAHKIIFVELNINQFFMSHILEQIRESEREFQAQVKYKYDLQMKRIEGRNKAIRSKITPPDTIQKVFERL